MDELDEEEAEELEGLGRKRRFRRRRRSEGLSWPLWDSATVATGATTLLTLFQVPVGTSSKTKLDTNMNAAGLIQQGTIYQVQSIGFGLQKSAATVIPLPEYREILETGYLMLTVAEREMFSARLTMLPFGGGPFVSAGPAAGGEQVPNAGTPAHGARYTLKRKLRIPKNVHFEVTLNWPTAPTPTAAITAIVWFDGIMWRPRV